MLLFHISYILPQPSQARPVLLRMSSPTTTGRVRNNDILLTEHMEVLATRIIEHGNGLPEGTPVVAKELLHLGSRAAVDQALSRLVRRGTLMRAGRGIYVRPVESRFGARPPV